MEDNEYIGSILMVGQNYASEGYAPCEGQLLKIADFQPLYTLIDSLYGGDGRSTIAVPDLRGRTPAGEGSGPGLSPFYLGMKPGKAEVKFTVTEENMPVHTHQASFRRSAISPKTTADFSGSVVRGTLACNADPGDRHGPAGNIPAGTAARAWAASANASMAVDVIGDGELDPLEGELKLQSASIPVPLVEAGFDQDVTVPLEMPAHGIPFLICTNGIYPPRD
ncbi:MAG: tail fiber protein [bacterium]|nr:tail fiber protein [bacterium]